MKAQPCLKFFCVFAAAALFLVRSGHAATISLAPTQDTYVWSGSGGDDNLNGDADGLSLGASTRVYIQWDLSQIPANSTITGAHIELHQFNTGSSTTTSSAWYRTATFDETTLTWISSGGATHGGTALTSLGTFGVISTASGTKVSGIADASEIDLLQDLYDNNGSFVYFLSATGSGFRLFVNREGTGGTALQAPHLVVDYSPIPEPSAAVLAMIGVCFAGYSARRKRNN